MQSPNHAQKDREADLYYALQLGYRSIREANNNAVQADFKKMFGDDPEAVEQFNAGVKQEEAKRTELGMTPGQYHAHFEAKLRAFRERRDAVYIGALGQ